MKKIILSLAILGFSSLVKSQEVPAQMPEMREKEVPLAVTEAFRKAYPSVKKLEWNKVGKNYEAEYKQKKIDSSVTYDPSGNLIETKVETDVAALPAPVIKYVKNNYKKNKIKKAAKITDANGTVSYEAKVKGDELVFDSQCNFVKPAKN